MDIQLFSHYYDLTLIATTILYRDPSPTWYSTMIKAEPNSFHGLRLQFSKKDHDVSGDFHLLEVLAYEGG